MGINFSPDDFAGQMTTPMRKMIMKMSDMAEVVCSQCITDNGKKPEDEDYQVTCQVSY